MNQRFQQNNPPEAFYLRHKTVTTRKTKARISRTGAAVLAFLLVAPNPVLAQESRDHDNPAMTTVPVAAGPELGLNEAIALSQGDQPSLAAYERDARASEEAAVAAGTKPDPVLQTSIQSYPVTGRTAFSPNRDDFTMYTIGFMREEVRRSKREAAAAALRADAVVSRTQGTVQERRIRRNVMVAWINAVEASSKQRLLARIISDLQVAHRVMEAGIPTGAATPSDALQMQAEISLAEAQRGEARGQERRARAELARWIGDAARRPLPTRIPSIDLPAGTDAGFDPSSNPEVRVADAEEAAAKLRTDVARRDRRPNISWGANYSFRPDYGNFIGLQLSIPLQLNRSKLQDRRIAEASERESAAGLRAQDMRRDLNGQYYAAIADYQAADAQLTILTSKSVPSLEASFDAAEARYGAGQGTLELPLSLVRRYVETTIQTLEEQAKRARAATDITYLTQDVAK